MHIQHLLISNFT